MDVNNTRAQVKLYFFKIGITGVLIYSIVDSVAAAILYLFLVFLGMCEKKCGLIVFPLFIFVWVVQVVRHVVSIYKESKDVLGNTME